MHSQKRWNIAPPDPRAAELASRLKTSPLLAQILLNRGFEDPQAALQFLNPTPKGLADPALIPNLTQASDRIAKAIRDKEKIVVYGDYDVDGITAVSILWHAITQLGGQVDYYIPHRIDEGYGLNAQALAQLCAQGANLIITVDCGITAKEPAKICRQHNVDLIITDHHEWHSESKDEGGRMKDETNSTLPSPPVPAPLHPSSSILHPSLPDCHSIVHPRLPGSTYPNPHLCGAGVAFKLAWGIGLAVNGHAAKVSSEFRQFLVEATALAALGTVADVVPLTGENRILTHWGLGGLKESKLHGIQALIASANLTGQNLDSYHIGFLLGPRLNACGRMGHARQAVEMLTHASFDRAIEIATYLEKQNRERQTLEKRILEEALEQVKQLGLDKDDCKGVVLGAEGWHSGVIGIVASRLVDRLHKPAVMIATTNGHGQGSARSIAGFHLAKALEACAPHLESFGGHEMAAGLKIQTPKLPDFREAFCHHAAQNVSDEMMTRQLNLECLAELNMITQALVTDLARLGPFGHGNRKPLLACKNLEISAPPKRVGKTGDHLQLFVKQGQSTMKCIAFNHGNMIDQLKKGTLVNLAVEPQLNQWQGRTSVELEVKDLQIEPN